jgi:hypothetical protein
MISRLRLLALSAIALLVCAAPASARSGYQLYTSGLYGVEARATIHHTTLTIDKWRCHYGTTFGGNYDLDTGPLATLKVSHAGRFSKHLTMNYEFLNLQSELEESRQSVAVSGRFLRNGKIKGTIASSLCDAGKPQPFTLSSVGFEV